MAKLSPRFTFNQADWQKWGKNSLVFAAPFLLVFLVAIQQGTDFKKALYIVYLYALNVIIDWLRKFIDGPAK